MKHICFIIALFSVFLYFGCGKECKTITHIEYPIYIHKILDVYRPGCYFIYLNQDSTKYDSIYISDYRSGVDSDRFKDCLSTNGREFIMHSSYLSTGGMVYCSYYGLESGNARFDGHSLNQNSPQDRDWIIICDNNGSNLRYTNGQELTQVPYYMLWNNPDYILESVSISKESSPIFFPHIWE